MTTQFMRGQPQEHRESAVGERRHYKRGGEAEALLAAGGIVLAILGLAGAAPHFLDTIADIALGLAFLFERWTVSARVRDGVLPAPHGEHGLTSESVAGWAGVVLGILSLLRLAPTVLTPISLILFGAGLALGSGVVGSRSGRLLVGLAAIVLGVLSIIQIDPRTLTLIGLIGVGAALLLSGPVATRRADRRALAERAAA